MKNTLIIALFLISFGSFAQKAEVKSDTVRAEIALTDFQVGQLKAVAEQMKPLREKEELLVSVILDASGKVEKDRTIIGFYYDEKNKKFLIATVKKK